MLIGAHVSVSGGLPKAVARGVALDCEAIQIFNQSPRMWKPTAYTDDDFAAFREAKDASAIESVVIHAVYLINCSSPDPELWDKSVASLTHALRVGDAIGADGVVLHSGHEKKDEDYGTTITRIAKAVKQAVDDTETCPLLLENAAGKTAIGRSFEHLHDLVEALDGHPRVGVCLDSCHMFAAGYDVRSAELLGETVDEFDKVVGLDRLRCIHLNDSKGAFESNIDRHENLGVGAIGREGCAAVLSEPRFEQLPVVMETPGRAKDGPDDSDVTVARELRAEGLKARAK